MISVHNHLLAFLSGRPIFTYRDVQLLTGVTAIQYYAGIIQVLLRATHVGIVQMTVQMDIYKSVSIP